MRHDCINNIWNQSEYICIEIKDICCKRIFNQKLVYSVQHE